MSWTFSQLLAGYLADAKSRCGAHSVKIVRTDDWSGDATPTAGPPRCWIRVELLDSTGEMFAEAEERTFEDAIESAIVEAEKAAAEGAEWRAELEAEARRAP